MLSYTALTQYVLDRLLMWLEAQIYSDVTLVKFQFINLQGDYREEVQYFWTTAGGGGVTKSETFERNDVAPLL